MDVLKCFKVRMHWRELIFACIGIFLISCGPSASEKSTNMPVVNVRAIIDHPTRVPLNDAIHKALFVQLEETDNDETLIDGVADYAVTDDYIYVLPVKEPRIVLFDRKGRFVKTLVRGGQGPGEFSGLLFNIQAVPARNRLYLFGSLVWEYTLDGQFIRQFKHDVPMMSEFCIAPERFAAVAMGFVPFQAGSFGIGVFTDKGEKIWQKNNFHSPLVPSEISGFTANLTSGLSNDGASLLFKTGSNDTVFRMTADSIEAACVLELGNSDAETIRSLNTTDFSDIHGFNRNENDIFVQDIFETADRYYFRCRYNQGFSVIAVDKQTGKAWVERCEQPAPLQELAKMGSYQYGLLGTRSYKQFPIWGRVYGKELVQVITPTELAHYKKLDSIVIPESLENEKENANPFFAFYQLK